MNANNDQAFLATSYLDALPPVGQFPSATLDADRLTQRFFPPGIEVELSFIPEDELAAVVEESLLVPPIDLAASLDQLSGTGVVVLLPLSREQFAQNRSVLPNWDAEAPRLRPVFSEIKARATPRELLLSRMFTPVAAAAPPTEEEAWRQLLRAGLSQRLLWYVRRRHLPIASNVAGRVVSADSIAMADPRALIELMKTDAPLAERVTRLRSIDVPEVNTLTRRLSERRFVDNPALLRSLVARAAGAEGTSPTSTDVVIALAATTDPALGKGLAMLTEESGTLARTLNSDRIVESGVLADIDRLARDVPAERLPELVTELRTAVKSGEDISDNLVTLRRKFLP
jgi:hypothetical protein